MTASPADRRACAWRRHDAEWRSPAQIAGFWEAASRVDPLLLRSRVVGPWWELLAALGITLLVSREYEHLVIAMSVHEGRPLVSYLRLPHPSGLVCDRDRETVTIASTRNPNQLVTLRPVDEVRPADGKGRGAPWVRRLIPVRAVFLPGRLYLHDLALIGGKLHANAVGQNAVVRLADDGGFARVWWPRCIETPDGPVFDRNHLQLNSIAAGGTVGSSFFTASTDRPSRLRPGHRRFPVDGRGVVFSGRSREPICRGLTRPHSARLHRGRIWVANSGYGQLGVVSGGRFEATTALPGWTRGVCIVERGRAIAFVGTSRVLPRFRQYAPGLDVERSVCAVHAVDLASGRTVASLEWPEGNQTFALDWLPAGESPGFPFEAGRRAPGERLRALFYSFAPAAGRKERVP
ncbi:MAG TPA: DUF4915 domain-containing protein [Thermoanaerobaculaceae bacterium]|nr:DUF4915 domain-containing protein [Thermoanaerobaculaceae bacterium]